MAQQPRTSVYHCGECEQETNVDGAGTCPVTAGPHVVDLVFHHGQAHGPDDRDPDCHLCDRESIADGKDPL